MGFNFNGMMQGLGSGLVGYGQAMEAQAKLDWETNRDNVKWEREKHFQELQAKAARDQHSEDLQYTTDQNNIQRQDTLEQQSEDRRYQVDKETAARIEATKMQTETSRSNKELGMAQINAQLQMKREDRKDKDTNDNKSWEDTRTSLDSAYPNLSEEKKDLLATAIEDGKQPMAAMILRGTEYDKQPRVQLSPSEKEKLWSKIQEEPIDTSSDQMKAIGARAGIKDKKVLEDYAKRMKFENQIQLLEGDAPSTAQTSKDGVLGSPKGSVGGTPVPTQKFIEDAVAGFNQGKLTVDQMKSLGIADQVPGVTKFVEDEAKRQNIPSFSMSNKEKSMLVDQYLNQVRKVNEDQRKAKDDVSTKAQEYNDVAIKMYKKPYFNLNAKEKEEVDFNLR